MQEAILQIRLWFEDEKGRVIFGPGRALLLEKIKELGSLHKAAKELGMSYRAAWGKIKLSEKVLGEKLLIKDKGRTLKLTSFALDLLLQYESWRTKVYNYAQEQASFLEEKSKK